MGEEVFQKRMTSNLSLVAEVFAESLQLFYGHHQIIKVSSLSPDTYWKYFNTVGHIEMVQN